MSGAMQDPSQNHPPEPSKPTGSLFEPFGAEEQPADVGMSARLSGTHPLSILSVVSGVAAIMTLVSCCIAPILAPLLQGICGLLALTCGVITLRRVQTGHWDRESNQRQGKLGTALGLLGLLLALGWLVAIWEYGPGLEFKPPPDMTGERSPLPFTGPRGR